MKILTLMENTCDVDELDFEHGLSLYIETKKHKILFDMGQSENFASNAEKLGVKLDEIDIAVLSHGHYDHGGGLKKFLELNQNAKVYINKHAFENHFSGKEKYIGLDLSLLQSDRLIFTSSNIKLDDELEIYSGNFELKFPIDSAELYVKENDELKPEDFRHEQYLLVNENNTKVLFSGCSHRGILNIQTYFQPNILVGGFHFKKYCVDSDKDFLINSAKYLMKYNTMYYTCHCTGVEQFEFLKQIMGEQLEYLSVGAVAFSHRP